MKFALLILSICLVSASLGNPSDHDLLIRQRRDINFIGNTKVLVEELIQNLRNSAQHAFDSVKTFASGIQDQNRQFADKLASDVQKVRDRVRLAINNISDRFTDAGSGVRECIDSHRKDVDNVFSNTVEQSKQCAGDRVREIGDMIENLRELSSNATDYASNAITELRDCTDEGQGLLSTGTCLSRIAIRAELKGAVFLTRSGLLISRINLAMSTLPAALEVCAGAKLVEAGVNSAKIVMEVGTCSASSIFSSLTGNTTS